MDVTGTFGLAWERTKRVLFRPFDIGIWFSFGVIFFLQALLDGSGSFSGRFPSSSRRGGASGLDLKEVVDTVRTWVSDNMSLVIAIGATIAIVGAAFMLLLLWLGTRGQMMAIRSVMTGRATIGEHWRATRVAGWSLFKVHVGIGLISSRWAQK